MGESKPPEPMFVEISFIMFHILLDIIEMEFDYAATGNEELLIIIEYNNWLLDYWEKKLFEIHGYHAFDPMLFF